VIDPALAGLIGVGVGGVLTFAVEERKAWADRRNTRNLAEGELRQAARLVEEEWFSAWAAATYTVEYREWWDDAEIGPVERQAWEQYAPRLAASDEITEEQWDALNNAAHGVTTVERVGRRHDTAQPPPARAYPLLVGAANTIPDGVNVLRGIRGVHALDPNDGSAPWYEEAKERWLTAYREAEQRGEKPPELEAFLEDA
jgi:hypothetical protein